MLAVQASEAAAAAAQRKAAEFEGISIEVRKVAEHNCMMGQRITTNSTSFYACQLSYVQHTSRLHACPICLHVLWLRP